MANLLIQSLGCPNCGGAYDPKSRNCRFCGSVLIVTSIADTFSRNLDAQQVANSVDKWRKRQKADPDNAEAHFALGLSYLNSKLRDASLSHLRKAALLAPEVADTHYNLAVALFNDGDILLASPEYAEAIKEIDYSTRLAPDFLEATAFRHFILARKLSSVDTNQALDEYTKAIKACPDIALIHNNLGMCYLEMDRFEEAEDCFQLAIANEPRLATSYSNLCLVMYRQGNYQKGIELGSKAVSLMGMGSLPANQAMAHSNLAICLWKSKRKSEALEHIRKAVAISPENPIFHQNLQGIQANPIAWWGWLMIVASVLLFGYLLMVITAPNKSEDAPHYVPLPPSAPSRD